VYFDLEPYPVDSGHRRRGVGGAVTEANTFTDTKRLTLPPTKSVEARMLSEGDGIA